MRQFQRVLIKSSGFRRVLTAAEDFPNGCRQRVAAPPLDGFYVWWHEDTPDRIRLATNNPDIVGEDGEKPGLQVVFRAIPGLRITTRHFNRLVRWLELHNKPHPHPVPIADRPPDRRPR
jgi:hypothetical protein